MSAEKQCSAGSAEAIARRLAKWIRYSWEGLGNRSVVDRGFPEWAPGGSYQGGQIDLMRLAQELIVLSAPAQGAGERGHLLAYLDMMLSNSPDPVALSGLVCKHGVAIETCASRECDNPFAYETAIKRARDFIASQPSPAATVERDINKLRAALEPFTRIGGPDDGVMPAYHDCDDNVVVYANSGQGITAGDVRAARAAYGILHAPWPLPPAPSEPQRCAECTCEKGAEECKWIAPARCSAATGDAEYRQAIDEALVTRHLGVAKGNARDELNIILSWEVDVALDPRVSAAAQALIDQGRALPQAVGVPIDQVARSLALSYGRDPDAMTDMLEMCDAHNRPVPIWRVYEEQAEALLAAYSITRPHGGGK